MMGDGVDVDSVTDEQLIDVVVVDVPLEKEKAMNVALNNEHIQGKWDYESLAELLGSMSEQMRDMTFLPDFEIQPLLEGEWKAPALEDDMPGDELIDKKKEHVCPECGHKFSED